MAVKPRFRSRRPLTIVSLPRPWLRAGRRVAIVALATTIALLGLGASPGLAATGSVYFDSNGNAAAGNGGALFNGTFTGFGNSELAPR